MTDPAPLTDEDRAAVVDALTLMLPMNVTSEEAARHMREVAKLVGQPSRS